MTAIVRPRHRPYRTWTTTDGVMFPVPDEPTTTTTGDEPGEDDPTVQDEPPTTGGDDDG